MKKIVALLLALCMVFALCACGETKPAETKEEEAAPVEEAPAEEAPAEEAPAEETPAEEAPAEEAPAVMSYEEFAAAEVDSPVVIESYLQAKQEYNTEYSNTSLYLQDEEGAYFVYRLACSQEEYDALTVGQKLKVTGFKSEWGGEIEIADATIEALEAEPWQAEPVDLTDVWGSPDLINYQNRLVSFKGVTVEEYKDGEGNPTGAAFAYQNSEEKSGDLYFQVTLGDTTYEFCVETALISADSDLYKAVEGLQIGDTVDLEGFLYWYEGPNLHTTGIGVKAN